MVTKTPPMVLFNTVDYMPGPHLASHDEIGVNCTKNNGLSGLASSTHPARTLFRVTYESW